MGLTVVGLVVVVVFAVSDVVWAVVFGGCWW